jgi:hypothetical protein
MASKIFRNGRPYVCLRHLSGEVSRAEHVRSARVLQTSTCSAIDRASSTSIPRYLTVLSSPRMFPLFHRIFLLLYVTVCMPFVALLVFLLGSWLMG